MKKETDKKADISIILPCHNEGILVHRTINSIRKAIKHTISFYPQLIFEIIISLDNPTPETNEYFKENNDKTFKIYQCKFSDAGKNRNYAISQAKGEFIALIDADDLITDNWFTEAYIQAIDPKNPKTLFHPRWTVYFERENLIAKHIGSDESDFHFSNLIESNYWSALFFCKRSVFSDLAYEDTREGYAYEDWHFYCEALAKGYTVHVIDKTAYYIRRKKQGSRLMLHNQKFNTIQSSRLFTKEIYGSFVNKELSGTNGLISHPSAGKLRAGLRMVKNKLYSITRGRMNGVLDFTSRNLKRRIGITYQQSIDLSLPTFDWLIEDWKGKNSIEPMLFPDGFLLTRFHYYQIANNFTGLIYASLLNAIPGDIDYMFIIPWLKPGGAEKVLFNYISYLLKINPKYKIAVIATERSNAPWAHKLPEEVFYFELANNSINLEQSQRLEIIMKYIIQYPPYAIHVINSELGHQLIQKYGQHIKNKSKLYCSTFCEGYSEEGKLLGLMFEYLPTTYYLFKGISTDNKRIINKLKSIYAFNTDNFFVHYQPLEILNTGLSGREIKTGKEINILWAGRIDDQKWPELLFEICDKSINFPIKFHIWGATVLDKKGVYQHEINKRSNIIYHGSFDDFFKLPLDQYDLLLYTSKYDGLPNIILEAMSAGLPIISTGNGGIPEVIHDKKSGFIINNSDDFLSVIKTLLDNKSVLSSVEDEAKKIIKHQHSEGNFLRELRGFPGYLR